MPICFRLATHVVFIAWSFAFDSAGNSIAASDDRDDDKQLNERECVLKSLLHKIGLFFQVYSQRADGK